MTKVSVRPVYLWMKNTPKRLWPGHPPVFFDAPPEGASEADIQLARDLYLLLDEDSKNWYGHHGTFEGL